MKGFTSVLSSPRNLVGDLLLSLLFLNNDRFPTTTLGNDSNSNGRSRNPEGRTLAGRQTLRNDVCLGRPHGKTYFVIPEGFCRGSVFIQKGKRQISELSGPPIPRG